MTEAKHTPGPWRWEINRCSKTIYLAGGTPRYDLYVMGFARWGMGGAQPKFLRDAGRASERICGEAMAVHIVGREHHARWCATIDHPDANLIAAAPTLLEACEAVLSIGLDERTRKMVEGAVMEATKAASATEAK